MQKNKKNPKTKHSVCSAVSQQQIKLKRAEVGMIPRQDILKMYHSASNHKLKGEGERAAKLFGSVKALIIKDGNLTNEKRIIIKVNMTS